MKRTLVIILLAALSLSACGKENVPNCAEVDPVEKTEIQTTTELSQPSGTEETKPTEIQFTTAKETEATEPSEPTQITEASDPVAMPTTTVPESTYELPVETEEVREETNPPPVTEPPEATEANESTEPPQTEPPEETSSKIEAPATESPSEEIDTAALEAYGRQYAEETYGYWGNPDTGFLSNAGYFPPSWVTVTTMEEGRGYVRELIDAQYLDDTGAGHPIYAEIDGREVRRKINILFEATDTQNIYLLYCFYGGE